MANGIESAIQDRASESGDFSRGSPTVQIVATVEEDLSRNSGELALASVRRELMAGDPRVSNVVVDHVVDSFAVDTSTVLVWSEAETIRRMLTNALEDEGMTVGETAVRADA